MKTTTFGIIIEPTINGFIVREPMANSYSKQWAFETTDSLAKFIREYGKEIEAGREAKEK